MNKYERESKYIGYRILQVDNRLQSAWQIPNQQVWFQI